MGGSQKCCLVAHSCVYQAGTATTCLTAALPARLLACVARCVAVGCGGCFSQHVCCRRGRVELRSDCLCLFASPHPRVWPEVF